MARYLASAFALIRPSVDGFETDAKAKLDAATKNLRATATLTTEVDQTKIDTFKAKLDELTRRSVVVKAGLDDKELQLKATRIQLALDRLSQKKITPEIDPRGFDKLMLQLAAADVGLDKLSAKSADAGTSAVKLGGDLNKLSGLAMPAMIAAGAALSPILVTLGFGMGGFGLAAAGTIKPIEDAAKKTGGLRANMSSLNAEQQTVAKGILALGQQYGKFEKALQPEVVAVFNQGLKLAASLLSDVQPVAKATGTALEGMLASIDAEFKSQTWQQFFKWMAANAGPDVQQLTAFFTSLLQALPPLLEALQPLGSSILTIGTDAAKALGPLAQLLQMIDDNNHNINTGAKSLDALTVSLTNKIPGFKAVNDWLTKVQKTLTGTGQAAVPASQAMKNLANGTASIIAPLGTVTGGLGVYRNKQISATQAAQAETQAQNALNTALTNMVGPLLTAQQDQVAWKQSQQAATAAINANSGSLDTNKAKALAARSAIIQSTQAAVSLAQAEVKQTGNTTAASKVIQDQINWLKQHAAHSKFAAQEIQFLTTVLNGLPKNVNSHVNVSGSGSGGVTFKQSFTGQSVVDRLLFQAQGGLIPGAGNRDTVPAMLTPGEVVVPAGMVQAGAVDHLRGMLPGFATGGFVGLENAIRSAPGQAAKHGAQFEQHAMSDAIKAAVAAAKAAAAAGAPGAMGGPTSASAAAAQAYARSRLGAYGWGAAQMSPLIALWNQESGWNRLARNPSSGAYGIPQALPPGKMGAQANPPTSSAAAQINWGLSYIAGRYGSPAGAESHELAYHWYAKGGLVGKINRALSVIHGHPGLPQRYNKAEIQLESWIGRVAQDRALRRAGAHHTGLDADERHVRQLRRAIAPMSKERQIVRHAQALIDAQEKGLPGAISIAKGRGMGQLAGQLTHRLSRDRGLDKTFGGWLSRLGPAYTAREKSSDSKWIDSLINSEARGMGLPIGSFDKGGWLPTGLSLAYNGLGRPERVGNTQTIKLEFGRLPNGTAFERAIGEVVRSFVIGRGGDPAVALGTVN